jgi:flagellar hook-length control protein FliK
MFAGLREAATLQPSSRSAYEVLPNESANAHSIVQTLRLQATAGGGTAVISLAPKYLGSVTVSLRVVDGGVTATLHAESPSVRAWIDANVPLLRDGLAEQGLRLERVIVAETPESRHNGEDHTRDEHERPPVPTRRPRRREDRTFDVVV